MLRSNHRGHSLLRYSPLGKKANFRVTTSSTSLSPGGGRRRGAAEASRSKSPIRIFTENFDKNQYGGREENDSTQRLANFGAMTTAAATAGTDAGGEGGRGAEGGEVTRDNNGGSNADVSMNSRVGRDVGKQ